MQNCNAFQLCVQCLPASCLHPQQNLRSLLPCRWGDVEFPLPFGRALTAAETHIAGLDAATGASLKLSILNPKGRVWTMVAGGGASVIYADTVGDLGFANELGNYAEYSGAPNAQARWHRAKPKHIT